MNMGYIVSNFQDLMKDLELGVFIKDWNFEIVNFKCKHRPVCKNSPKGLHGENGFHLICYLLPYRNHLTTDLNRL